jgi:hypothetical protein
MINSILNAFDITNMIKARFRNYLNALRKGEIAIKDDPLNYEQNEQMTE